MIKCQYFLTTPSEPLELFSAFFLHQTAAVKHFTELHERFAKKFTRRRWTVQEKPCSCLTAHGCRRDPRTWPVPCGRRPACRTGTCGDSAREPPAHPEWWRETALGSGDTSATARNRTSHDKYISIFFFQNKVSHQIANIRCINHDWSLLIPSDSLMWIFMLKLEPNCCQTLWLTPVSTNVLPVSLNAFLVGSEKVPSHNSVYMIIICDIIQ